VGADIDYVVVERGGDSLVLAKELVEKVFQEVSVTVVSEKKGSELVGITYEPLYAVALVEAHAGKKHEVLAADFVTTTDGAILNDKTCLQVAFSLPYGKTYIDPECRLDNNISNPSTIGYNPIFSLTSLDSVANSKATIVLAWPGGSQTKSIVVDGVSGRVEIQ
jgi:hypothetical protein